MASVEFNKCELAWVLLVVAKKMDKLTNAGKSPGDLTKTYEKLKKAQKEEESK